MSLFELSQLVVQLSYNVERLRDKTKTFGFPAPEEEGWYNLLNGKVLRQLSKRPFLVVAIMGGTNTGKSVVFNHLAGEKASAADYRAAGTKHPVCLIPPIISEQTQNDGYENETAEELLRRHFNSFHIIPWTQAEDALQKGEEHLLFWRVGENVPPKLLLLDTPDIDSDVETNWERAKTVRDASDLILAVLTEQKYADAAVKRFFREATAAGKPVIILFNMVDIENDSQEVPHWIKQFRRETGTNPTDVIVAPRNRDAAADLNLQFEKWKFDDNNNESNDENLNDTEVQIHRSPQQLTDLLARLHFEKIKMQTLLGALQVVCNQEKGIPKFLEKIRDESQSWGSARKTLENAEGIKMSWPTLPTPMLIKEIQSWWELGRPLWSQKIHYIYRKLGNALFWPIKKALNALRNQNEKDVLTDFQKQEDETVTKIVEKTIDQLEKLAQTDNLVLKSALEELLPGEKRQNILEQAKNAHQALVPIGDDFREHLQNQLQSWTQKNSKKMKMFRSWDSAAAIAHPIATLAFILIGFALASSVVNSLVLQTVIAIIVAGICEVLLYMLGEGVKHHVAKFFQKTQEEYAQKRAQHFFQWFRNEIWGSLLDRLGQGESVPESTQFIDVQKSLAQVTEKLQETGGGRREA